MKTTPQTAEPTASASTTCSISSCLRIAAENPIIEALASCGDWQINQDGDHVTVRFGDVIYGMSGWVNTKTGEECSAVASAVEFVLRAAICNLRQWESILTNTLQTDSAVSGTYHGPSQSEPHGPFVRSGRSYSQGVLGPVGWPTEHRESPEVSP